MSARAFAPAKINLYLHVGPLRSDGFHPINSLMVFADVGDEVSIASGSEPPLRLTGPFASGLGDADNLVVRAARHLAAHLGRRGPLPALVLDKRLPVASGLGGGSADAAATLRLLNAEWKAGLSPVELEGLAADLGSDVPACVRSRPVTASGRGRTEGLGGAAGRRYRPEPARRRPCNNKSHCHCRCRHHQEQTTASTS